MIISYAWTTPALLALRKHRTRRHWQDSYAERWLAGSTHKAYDHLPRAHGKQVGTVTLKRHPFKENTKLMTEVDYELEGLKYMEEQGLFVKVSRGVFITPRSFFDQWREAGELVWVIDFDFSPFEKLI